MARCSGDRRASGDDRQPDGCHGPRRDRVRRRTRSVAFSTDRTVMLWNPAAERMFGWAAAEVVGLEPQIIPEELKAEHNAVLERVRGGGQISFATRRIRKDSTAASTSGSTPAR